MTTTATITLTARLFGRSEVTEHATEADAMARVAKIAAVQSCRISRQASTFIPQVWAGDHHVDDPRCPVLGTFEIA